VTLARIRFGLYGKHSAKIAAAAFGVGDLMGLTTKQLQAGISAIKPVSGRMNPLAGLNGAVIIDDTYNASPDSALAALAALAKAPATRRIAIMGAMNELGAASPRYHQEVGTAAGRAGLDLLITVGDLARTHLGPAALAAGLDPRAYKAAESPYAAGEFLKLMLREGDVVLAKGSQNGVFAEEAVKLLLANPADAARLVRQSPVWLRRKAAQFADAPRRRPSHTGPRPV
jgi:UDP-N-acetylmuramyl pentapeptide synthase